VSTRSSASRSRPATPRPVVSEGGRLDAELVRRGIARSRAHAVVAIDEGRVSIDGRPAAKASTRVGPDAVLAIDGDDRYVSRSALKLAAGLDAFPIRVADTLALDVGASTGGFTQVLLERGAREVIALDVGHGQLAPALRDNPRVRVVEGVNARNLDPAGLAAAAGTSERPELVVADVSFISLTTILPALVATVGPTADQVLLVKPQFEVGRQRVREGVVRDRGLRQDAVSGVAWAAHDAGLAVAGIIPSPVLGSNGNQEYLLWLSVAAGIDPTEWEHAVRALP
jgi:23S rRNA (cytidine1920-2'-O)/16S rRNA (cytidine1409-2'-O)-methyltransferase